MSSWWDEICRRDPREEDRYWKREILGEWSDPEPEPLTHREVTRYLRELRKGGPRDPWLDERILREMEPAMPVTVSEPEPEDGSGEAGDDSLAELLEVLLCPTCGVSLGSPPCSPLHALLQDSPLQHPLLLPLVEREVKSIRADLTPNCPACMIPIATEDCPHIVDKFGQIWMSRDSWEGHKDQYTRIAGELGALQGLHDGFVETVTEERRRAEADRKRWAAEWAAEKFARLCASAGWVAPSRKWQAHFQKMLEEDL